MVKLVVVSRNGSESTIEADEGISLMEALRDNGMDELLFIVGQGGLARTQHAMYIRRAVQAFVGQWQQIRMTLGHGGASHLRTPAFCDRVYQ